MAVHKYTFVPTSTYLWCADKETSRSLVGCRVKVDVVPVL
jgi:hypothetical protein